VRDGSDVDLALIIRGKLDWQIRRALLNRLYLAAAKKGIPAEFHLKSDELFEAERMIPGLSKTVMEEGRLLWTRN
jgi:hypothetical protein